MSRETPLTVGDLRKAIEGVRDDMPVIVEIARDESSEEADDLPQAYLRTATPEFRCADEEALFLWGDADADRGEDDGEEPDDKGDSPCEEEGCEEA